MGLGVIAQGMPFGEDAAAQVRVRADLVANDKECRAGPVAGEQVEHSGRVAFVRTIINSQPDLPVPGAEPRCHRSMPAAVPPESRIQPKRIMRGP